MDLKATRIEISGFKALSGFRMELANDLTLLIGMNGSGKSSILQALGFARYLAEGRGQTFFDERGWDRQDMRFRSNPRGKGTVVHIAVVFDSPWGKLRWDVQWGLMTGGLFHEQVRRKVTETQIDDLLLFAQKDGGRINQDEIPALIFPGSLMAAGPTSSFSGENGQILAAVRSWARGIRSLELLAPQYMKGTGRLSPNEIGIRGDRLGGFLASLSQEQKSRIVQRLGRIYPIRELTTVKKRAGWIDLRVGELYESLSEVAASHMSDGFMRLLALCALPELGDSVSLVLLDEIEDGIEPHILTRVVDLIRSETRAQIVATSHSPLLLNSIEVENVRLVTRTGVGKTIATSAENLQTFKEGSEYFGVGEMWANVDIDTLQKDVARAQANEPDKDVSAQVNAESSIQ